MVEREYNEYNNEDKDETSVVEREYNEYNNEDKDETSVIEREHNEDEVSEWDREDACYFYIPDKCENNITLGEIRENEHQDNINEYYSNGEEYNFGNKCSLL